MKTFHLIIDTSSHDFTLCLREKIPPNFRRIGLKSIIITQESTKIEKNIYVHCDIQCRKCTEKGGGTVRKRK